MHGLSRQGEIWKVILMENNKTAQKNNYNYKPDSQTMTIWLGKGNNCQTGVGLGGGGGVFPPSGQDLAGWTQMGF